MWRASTVSLRALVRPNVTRSVCVRHVSSAAAPRASVMCNGKTYAVPRAGHPIVGICLDGSSNEYFEAASAAGHMPVWDRILGRGKHANDSNFVNSFAAASDSGSPSGGRSGHHALASGAMPTFTNPNNVSIMSGVTPAVHGVTGNYYYDTATDREVMMTQTNLLRADSLFAKLHAAGTRIVILTAKEKLRSLLSFGLPHTDYAATAAPAPAPTPLPLPLPLPLVLSMEKANTNPAETAAYLSRFTDPARRADCSDRELSSLRSVLSSLRPPSIYDPDISTHMIEFAARLMSHDLQFNSHIPTLYYLSSTDYLQHTYAPDSPVAHKFYNKIDTAIGAFHALPPSAASGTVTVGITADHGMNDKVDHLNRPRIIFLASALSDSGFTGHRVILPITDPYIRHHAALGSFATIYLSKSDMATAGRSGAGADRVAAAMDSIRRTNGVYTVMNRAEAARAFELAPDRIGDIVVVADTHTVLGRSPADHDLSNLDGTLRSHGGLSEATVPLFISRPLIREYAQRLNSGRARNFHLFDFLCNGLA